MLDRTLLRHIRLLCNHVQHTGIEEFIKECIQQLSIFFNKHCTPIDCPDLENLPNGPDKKYYKLDLIDFSFKRVAPPLQHHREVDLTKNVGLVVKMKAGKRDTLFACVPQDWTFKHTKMQVAIYSRHEGIFKTLPYKEIVKELDKYVGVNTTLRVDICVFLLEVIEKDLNQQPDYQRVFPNNENMAEIAIALALITQIAEAVPGRQPGSDHLFCAGLRAIIQNLGTISFRKMIFSLPYAHDGGRYIMAMLCSSDDSDLEKVKKLTSPALCTAGFDVKTFQKIVKNLKQ